MKKAKKTKQVLGSPSEIDSRRKKDKQESKNTEKSVKKPRAQSVLDEQQALARYHAQRKLFIHLMNQHKIVYTQRRAANQRINSEDLRYCVERVLFE
ncbi:hypothetical protein FGIG_03030 [Fasciola gigantica]|uniref:Uncharacterized protein n=1 Tax=Fasciola gigantica TaxID=46835 RepID=A0A504Z0G6_FASGI|nr:hypothetical protein FGIG_03030 [Fasciola gigantica]